MPELPGYNSVVHSTVVEAKELSQKLADAIDNEFAGDVKISLRDAHLIAAQLRVSANLNAGLLEENARLIDQIRQLLNRL